MAKNAHKVTKRLWGSFGPDGQAMFNRLWSAIGPVAVLPTGKSVSPSEFSVLRHNVCTMAAFTVRDWGMGDIDVLSVPGLLRRAKAGRTPAARKWLEDLAAQFEGPNKRCRHD